MLKRRGLLAVAAALGTLVLAGCSGHTTGTTNIASYSATLNATARCDSGQTCKWYWQYWLDGYRFVYNVKTPVAGPVPGPTSDVHLQTTIRGLMPGWKYDWVLCGSPDNGGTYACVGPSGTAYPPDSGDQDVQTFTTANQPTLAESWDGTSWSIQSTPPLQVGERSAYLSAVSCTSATACAAVGAGSHLRAARWDGSTWTAQSVPEPQPGYSYLTGVACPFSCFAVGQYIADFRNNTYATLAERWDGAGWAIQTPPGQPINGGLRGVSCTSATICTAVGGYLTGNSNVTLAERWDGTAWAVQSTPNPSGYASSTLAGVSCTSATACTAVGQHLLANASGSYETLTERWDGTSWTIQPTPAQPSGVFAALVAVSCTSATSCIAVGHTNTDTFYSPDDVSTLAESWDGTKWTILPTPAPGSSSDLNAVSCTSSTACTAVGHYNTDSGSSTLVERWDGSKWTIQPSPNPPGQSNDLFGVSCASASACTAVGY